MNGSQIVDAGAGFSSAACSGGATMSSRAPPSIARRRRGGRHRRDPVVRRFGRTGLGAARGRPNNRIPHGHRRAWSAHPWPRSDGDRVVEGIHTRPARVHLRLPSDATPACCRSRPNAMGTPSSRASRMEGARARRSSASGRLCTRSEWRIPTDRRCRSTSSAPVEPSPPTAAGRAARSRSPSAPPCSIRGSARLARTRSRPGRSGRTTTIRSWTSRGSTTRTGTEMASPTARSRRSDAGSSTLRRNLLPRIRSGLPAPGSGRSAATSAALSTWRGGGPSPASWTSTSAATTTTTARGSTA